MILVSEEYFKAIQEDNLSKIREILKRMKADDALAVDYGEYNRYVARLAKISFIGEMDYESYLEYANDVLSRNDFEFFQDIHTKAEVRDFLRKQI